MRQSKAGVLREIVAFESRGVVDDGYGNEVSGPWIERFRANARIQFIKGKEEVLADRLQGTQPVVIICRYEPQVLTVNSDWQIRDVRSGVIYQIKSQANMDEKRQYIDFLAVAGVAG